MQSIEFVVEDEPVAQGRPRVTTCNGRIRFYDAPKSRAYKQMVAKIAADESQKQGWELKSDEPLKVSIKAYFAIPKSKPKKCREKALRGEIRHTKKPDVDNIAKSVLDALSGVLYGDDKQIVFLCVQKFYSDYPRCEVKIVEDEK